VDLREVALDGDGEASRWVHYPVGRFVLRSTVRQNGSGGTGETPSQLLHIFLQNASAVCALLPDAAWDRERVETCGLEPGIPIPVGFCGGSPGDQAGTSATRIANMPLPYEKEKLRHESGWRGRRSVAI